MSLRSNTKKIISKDDIEYNDDWVNASPSEKNQNASPWRIYPSVRHIKGDESINFDNFMSLNETFDHKPDSLFEFQEKPHNLSVITKPRKALNSHNSKNLPSPKMSSPLGEKVLAIQTKNKFGTVSVKNEENKLNLNPDLNFKQIKKIAK